MRSVQHQPGHGVHRPHLPPGRTGNVRADQAGRGDRGGGGHERHRDELGEPAGTVLDAGQQAQVRYLLRRGLDVPEDHRRRGGQPGAVRGLDHLHPLGHRESPGGPA